MDNLAKENLMKIAIEEANKAIKEGNSPFGAVLADNEGKIIEVAHNTTKTEHNPLAHAETNLILKAIKNLKLSDLSAYHLISNVQSCPMCFSAAIRVGIISFLYGCGEDETLRPKINVFELRKYCANTINIETGILEKECYNQLKKFRLLKK